MGKVMKPRIIKNKVNIIKQPILKVYDDAVRVISNNGKEYNVQLSDKVRLTMNAETGDTAIIKTFPNGWLVTDIKKQFKEEKTLTKEEECLELKRQEEELADIGWGMY